MADLRRLGIEAGDTVLVRAGLRELGPLEDRAKVFIEALLEAVGPEGTILGLPFTLAFLRVTRHRDYVFDPAVTPTYAGGFASALLEWPGAIRSSHPCNSFVAIGRLAQVMLAGHDESAPGFWPMKALLEHNGKMLSAGCISSGPGFVTIHWARQELGHTLQNIMRGWWKVFYRKNGEIKLFTVNEINSCSHGFRKFYGHYVEAGKLRAGFVGHAYSALISARDAYAVERPILERNPRAYLCDRPFCYSCRTTWYFNKRDWPGFWLRFLPRVMRGLRKL